MGIPQSYIRPAIWLWAHWLCLQYHVVVIEGIWSESQLKLVDAAVKECVKTKLGSGRVVHRKSYADRTAFEVFCGGSAERRVFKFQLTPAIGTQPWMMSKSLEKFLRCVQGSENLPDGIFEGLYNWYQALNSMDYACDSRHASDLNVQTEADSTLFDPQNFDPARKLTLIAINDVVSKYFVGPKSGQKASNFLCMGRAASKPGVNANEILEFQTWLTGIEEWKPLLTNLEKTLDKFNERMNSELTCGNTDGPSYKTLLNTKAADCLLPFAALLMGDDEKLKRMGNAHKICDKKFFVFGATDPPR